MPEACCSESLPVADQLPIKSPFPKRNVIVELKSELHDVLRPFGGFCVFAPISRTEELLNKISTCSYHVC